MSYDCCKKCGELADEPYKAMTKDCGKPDCPGKELRERWNSLIENLPSRDDMDAAIKESK